MRQPSRVGAGACGQGPDIYRLHNSACFAYGVFIATWTFITNHARVLLVIASDPTVRLRDIAATLDITERAAQRIVTELVDEGYLTRKRVGRRNHYEVHTARPMRSSQSKETEVGQFLQLLLDHQDPISS